MKYLKLMIAILILSLYESIKLTILVVLPVTIALYAADLLYDTEKFFTFHSIILTTVIILCCKIIFRNFFK